MVRKVLVVVLVLGWWVSSAFGGVRVSPEDSSGFVVLSEAVPDVIL